MLPLAGNANPDTCKRQYTVPDNLTIPIKLDAQVNAKSLKAGTELVGYTVYDIPVDGGGKIPKGSKGIFVCRSIVRPGPLGREASISISAQEIQISRGGRIFVRGNVVIEGESLQIESIGIGAAFCCLGFLIPGGDAVIGKGVVLTAFVEGDQKVTLPKQ